MNVLHFLFHHLLICIPTHVAAVYLWKRLTQLLWALAEKHILLPLNNLIFPPDLISSVLTSLFGLAAISACVVPLWYFCGKSRVAQSV
jgi:hypothetical protein